MFLAGQRLHVALAGCRLTRGELRRSRLSTVDLAGWTVREVASVGKQLFIRFDNNTTLHSHFRMDGSWHLYRRGQRWRGPGHQVRAVLATSDQVAVGFRLHDLVLLPSPDEHRLVGHLGPDLLGPGWGPDGEDAAVHRLAAHPNRELGLALLDQRVLAGLGNLYKERSLFPARPLSVDPDVRCGRRRGRPGVPAAAGAQRRTPRAVHYRAAHPGRPALGVRARRPSLSALRRHDPHRPTGPRRGTRQRGAYGLLLPHLPARPAPAGIAGSASSPASASSRTGAVSPVSRSVAPVSAAGVPRSGHHRVRIGWAAGSAGWAVSVRAGAGPPAVPVGAVPAGALTGVGRAAGWPAEPAARW